MLRFEVGMLSFETGTVRFKTGSFSLKTGTLRFQIATLSLETESFSLRTGTISLETRMVPLETGTMLLETGKMLLDRASVRAKHSVVMLLVRPSSILPNASPLQRSLLWVDQSQNIAFNGITEIKSRNSRCSLPPTLMKILILASNPRKDLNLDREIRDLREVIEKSRNRQEFQVEDALAVRVGDLHELLFKHRPQIVHFCGHGSGQQGLVFEGNDGGEQWVRTEALSDLFRLFSSHVRCVLLNACYSESQSDAIVNHINYVVGMNQEIRDDAAIAFSKGFYRALGYECSVEQVFEFGCNSIQLEISGSSKMRSATTEAVRKAEVVDAIQQTAISEHLKPILKTKPTLVAPPDQPLSQETRLAIQLDIDKSLETDAKVKQFRDEVREYLEDHKLAEHEKVFLEHSRQELGLSIAEAKRILDEEQAPIWAAQQAYRNRLHGLIQNGLYPFNDDIKSNLKREQTRRNLTDEEVAEISQPILEAAEAAYREKQAQQAQPEKQKLQRHEQEFDQMIAAPQKVFVEDLGGGVTLEMVAIAGGTFMMGSPDQELERSDCEGPQHSVTVQPFFMGKFAVTQAQWRAVAALSKVKIDLNPDPSRFKGVNRPLEKVSWYEAVEFCDRLCQKTGKKYRLPSEAEWEYACRAGTDTPFYSGETITTDLANYRGTDWEYRGTTYSGSYGAGAKGIYREQTTDVGSFPPNAFGLYDMHGNVWEWCADRWHKNYQGAPIDGSAWLSEDENAVRVRRGGSWYNNPRFSRSAYRNDYPDPHEAYRNYGFRVVCFAPRTLA
jgi:formylglycine-generating enzyme required for sulfatase activity